MTGEEFLARMRGGATAREAVIEEIHAELRRRTQAACAKVNLFDAHHVEDVVQHTMEVLWTKWEQVRPESTIWAWLYVVARNRAYDVYRSGRHFDGARSIEDVDAAQEDEYAIGHTENSNQPNEAERRDCINRIFCALEADPPARKGSVRVIDLIRFVAIEGPDTRTLAAYLKCTEAAAKERKRYALARFTELCNQLCGHGYCATSDRG